MNDKICRECGETYPLSADHWKKKKTGQWDSLCLICRAKVNRGKRSKKREMDMHAIEAGAVGAFLKTAQRGGDNIPHSSELLERLMEYFGGAGGFASLVVKQYFDSPAGGAHRTKLLEGVVRLVTKNTELGGAKKPLNQWTDEEIEQELDARLRMLAGGYEGRIVNAQAKPPERPSDFAAAIRLPVGGVPEVAAEGAAGGASEPPDRSPEAVCADSAAGGNARVQRKRSNRSGRK